MGKVCIAPLQPELGFRFHSTSLAGAYPGNTVPTDDDDGNLRRGNGVFLFWRDTGIHACWNGVSALGLPTLPDISAPGRKRGPT